MTEPATPPPHRSLIVSRAMLLAWCAWLLASWVVNLSIFSPQRTWVPGFDGGMRWQVSADAFVPVVQGMLVSMALALGLVWPAWRLSLPGIGASSGVAGEAAALWLVSQVVVWPLRILVEFDVERLILISLALAVAAAAAGLCIQYGRRSESPARRAAAMFAAVLVTLGPWIAAYMSASPGPARFSPLHILWSVCDPRADVRLMWLRLAAAGGVVGLAAVMMWITGHPALQSAPRSLAPDVDRRP